MNQILLVEDSPLFGRLAKKRIEETFDVPVYWCKNFAEADRLLIRASGNFSMAVLDFNLPDAPNGEVIDRVVGEGISALVFTSNLSDEVRKQVWSRRVVDYILKDDPNCIDYVIAAMQQLLANERTLVLVVDDSNSQRTALTEWLYIKKFRVVTAKDGPSALAILDQYPEIKLVITDYNMPGMNGCMLCRKIREKFKHDQMAIIGLSSEDERTLGARFIKSGANDFVIKQTFLVEEFYCRVEHSLHLLKLIEENRNAAIRDFLTGMYNRRYLFDQGVALCTEKLSEKQPVYCAMLDIDFFKKINDQFGHETGDRVLQLVAAQINVHTDAFCLAARIGGEEFCLLCSDLEKDVFRKKMIELHKAIGKNALQDDVHGAIRVTASIGWAVSPEAELHDLMRAADENLYRAKKAGRNRVVG